ncbi:hypothetical protein ANN_07745, partial [Periplaneta americana]
MVVSVTGWILLSIIAPKSITCLPRRN